MARSLRIEYPGAYYHVTSRGNERRAIFRNKCDRKNFLQYLRSAHLRYGAVVHAFCLMDNHYHLLMETPKGNLSQIMRHINGAYTAYFNVKHKRRGHLFQGRYKAILVDADAYAAELSRYIHLNPVRAGIVESPEKYIWSSYQYVIGKKKKPDWLYIDFILEYFQHMTLSQAENYADFVLAKIFDNGGSPLEKTVASTMLGSDSFIEKITEEYLRNKPATRDLPAIKVLKKVERIDIVYEAVRALLGNDNRITKKAALYICQTYSGKTLKEIGTYFGISESAVSLASSRFNQKMKCDRKMKKNIQIIVDKLNM